MMEALAFPNIGPDLFSIEIGGTRVAIRYYALAYIVGLLMGWRLIAISIRRPALWPGETPPIDKEQLESLLGWIIFGVIIGGRLGFVLFYQPDYYLSHPVEILKVWQGGMSFHGGFLGVVFVTWLFAVIHRAPLGSLADAMAFAAPPGIFLVRLANFINAELWGRPTDVPWAIAFPGEAAQDCPGIEGICGRHPSQLYEAGLEGLLLGSILLLSVFAFKSLHKPWLTAGMFFAGYGASRMFVELFRQADPQYITADNPMGHIVRVGTAGLSMGQLLSLPMLLVGLWLIARARRT